MIPGLIPGLVLGVIVLMFAIIFVGGIVLGVQLAGLERPKPSRSFRDIAYRAPKDAA